MSSVARYLIVVLVGILAALLYGWSQYRKGYADHENFTRVQIAIQNEISRAREWALIEKNDALDIKHYEGMRNAQKAIEHLIADNAAGHRRLSIRTKRPVCPSSNTAAASVDNGTPRAELDGQVAQDLIGIVAEGDQAIRQLNALQDYVRLIQQVE